MRRPKQKPAEVVIMEQLHASIESLYRPSSDHSDQLVRSEYAQGGAQSCLCVLIRLAPLSPKIRPVIREQLEAIAARPNIPTALKSHTQLAIDAISA